jgi:hypothetical protein
MLPTGEQVSLKASARDWGLLLFPASTEAVPMIAQHTAATGNKIKALSLDESIFFQRSDHGAGEATFQTKARENELAGTRSRRGFFGCRTRRLGYGNGAFGGGGVPSRPQDHAFFRLNPYQEQAAERGFATRPAAP